MKHLAHIILIVIIFSACSNRRAKYTVAMPDTNENIPTEIDTELLENDEKVIPIQLNEYNVLKITKHRCYTRCKEYEFTLNNEGLVFYHCKSECYPIISGHYHGFVGRGKVVEIKSFIRDKKLKSLNAQYPIGIPPVEGIPLTEIELGSNTGEVKLINNYHHAPKDLLVLEEMVEEMISEIEWEKSLE